MTLNSNCDIRKTEIRRKKQEKNQEKEQFLEVQTCANIACGK